MLSPLCPSLSNSTAERMIRRAVPELSDWAVLEAAGIVAQLPDGRADLERILSYCSGSGVQNPGAYLLAALRRTASS